VTAAFVGAATDGRERETERGSGSSVRSLTMTWTPTEAWTEKRKPPPPSSGSLESMVPVRRDSSMATEEGKAEEELATERGG
jgi:hypothetical protein